jgi:hypothetical protein
VFDSRGGQEIFPFSITTISAVGAVSRGVKRRDMKLIAHLNLQPNYNSTAHAFSGPGG